MATAKSMIATTVLFAVVSALMLLCAPYQSPLVITLFAVGELGGTGAICSLILRQSRRKSIPDHVAGAVVGYVVSHLGFLAAMWRNPFDADASPASQDDLVWMELTLRVGLFAVVIAATAVLLKTRARRSALPRMRKFTAAA